MNYKGLLMVANIEYLCNNLVVYDAYHPIEKSFCDFWFCKSLSRRRTSGGAIKQEGGLYEHLFNNQKIPAADCERQ